MRSATTIGKGVFGALFILALAAQASLHAAEPFEGLWAKTQKECLDEEGPNSRTLIDLGNIIKGKPAPIFDQYENHCRIERKTIAGDGTTLAATCFEFWENFTKGIEGQKATIKLAPGQKSTLKIDGILYQRCERNVRRNHPPARVDAKKGTENQIRRSIHSRRNRLLS
jgi:hypothetical protein